MRVIRTRPRTQPGSSKRFTGTAWLDPIAVSDSPSLVRVVSVHFAPGARTAWHHHPRGQILYILEGSGLVQKRGGPVEVVRAGDAVVTLPGEWHWHGASPSSFMTHLAIHEADDQGAEAYWGEHVTDEEYLVSRDDD
jgi:quercetin dioxygenase-like cupin family protein